MFNIFREQLSVYDQASPAWKNTSQSIEAEEDMQWEAPDGKKVTGSVHSRPLVFACSPFACVSAAMKGIIR